MTEEHGANRARWPPPPVKKSEGFQPAEVELVRCSECGSGIYLVGRFRGAVVLGYDLLLYECLCGRKTFIGNDLPGGPRLPVHTGPLGPHSQSERLPGFVREKPRTAE